MIIKYIKISLNFHFTRKYIKLNIVIRICSVLGSAWLIAIVRAVTSLCQGCKAAPNANTDDGDASSVGDYNKAICKFKLNY